MLLFLLYLIPVVFILSFLGGFLFGLMKTVNKWCTRSRKVKIVEGYVYIPVVVLSDNEMRP